MWLKQAEIDMGDLHARMSNTGFILWAVGSYECFRIHSSVIVIMTPGELSHSYYLVLFKSLRAG